MRKVTLVLQIEDISTKYFVTLTNENDEKVSFAIEGTSKEEKETEAVQLFKILSKYF